MVKSLIYPRSGPTDPWLGNDHSKGSFSGVPAMRGAVDIGETETYILPSLSVKHSTTHPEQNPTLFHPEGQGLPVIAKFLLSANLGLLWEHRGSRAKGMIIIFGVWL